jgi:hypothetical protein
MTLRIFFWHDTTRLILNWSNEVWKRTIYFHKFFYYQVKFQILKFCLIMPSPTHYKFYITMHPADYFTLFKRVEHFVKHKRNQKVRPLSRLLMRMKIAKSTHTKNELIWYYQLYTKFIIFIYFTHLWGINLTTNDWIAGLK